MCASAMASRWAVETPGRSSASIWSRTSATTRPAWRIRSISARDLRVTIVRPAPAPLSASISASVTASIGCRPSTVVRTPWRAVVLDDLEERRDLLGHPGPDGRLLVVGALDERRAVEVADAVDRGRVRDEVVDVAVGRADPPVGHPPDQVLERDVDVGGAVDPPAGLGQRARRAPRPGPGSAGSRRGSRRPTASARLEPVEEDPDDRLVRARAGRGSCTGRPRGRAACRRRPRPAAGRPTRGPGRRAGCARAGAWVPFPAPGAPRRTMTVIAPTGRRTSSGVRARARGRAAWPHVTDEAFVVPHHQLGLDLLHRLDDDRHDDQQARAAEAEGRRGRGPPGR